MRIAETSLSTPPTPPSASFWLARGQFVSLLSDRAHSSRNIASSVPAADLLPPSPVPNASRVTRRDDAKRYASIVRGPCNSFRPNRCPGRLATRPPASSPPCMAFSRPSRRAGAYRNCRSTWRVAQIDRCAYHKCWAT
ncbi:uncharacterized protein B0H18DRAFT_1035153 [Fomitopsis serialis]|uniref:uncharacterized protein n=1 Tax=Fomitopsis serialis TaxID=139415 RepID=UPI0020080A1F|nr:uncharacterized protein B0H18DRAFT_1035153 [Neoantrodia serialis]KAH9917236.1 hypothetical protein B0H18DRAFT_1035153 [Neoantrodia serialis]